VKAAAGSHADEYDLFLQGGFRQLTTAIRNNFENYALSQLKLEVFQFNGKFLPAVSFDNRGPSSCLECWAQRLFFSRKSECSARFA
jgi:hypothetical protein